MKIIPAIDLSRGSVVRLYKGDYDRMTVYSDDPIRVAKGFLEAGADMLHVVDLDGAKTGRAINSGVVKNIVEKCEMFVEIGGGIRTLETAESYISKGAGRVILGTAAVRDPAFLKRALSEYGEKIAVGVDIKNGHVALSGWIEDDGVDYRSFLDGIAEIGVKTVICTDISKDGAMGGTNLELYREISEKYQFDIIASGGVCSMEDIRALSEMNIYGAIIGRALYDGRIDLKEAVRCAEGI